MVRRVDCVAYGGAECSASHMNSCRTHKLAEVHEGYGGAVGSPDVIFSMATELQAVASGYDDEHPFLTLVKSCTLSAERSHACNNSTATYDG